LIVVDTSAVLAVLTGRPRDEELVQRLANDADLHAPHLIDVEVVRALRRLVSTGDLSPARAAEVRSDFAELLIIRYPHHPLSDRMWELRDTLSAYDAASVALAEVLGVPLITCDLRLARASGNQAQIEGFGGSR
jgi:predicted nucleic acid-binding protein